MNYLKRVFLRIVTPKILSTNHPMSYGDAIAIDAAVI